MICKSQSNSFLLTCNCNPLKIALKPPIYTKTCTFVLLNNN